MADWGYLRLPQTLLPTFFSRGYTLTILQQVQGVQDMERMVQGNTQQCGAKHRLEGVTPNTSTTT
jgi:hypothetical protein